eukprot:351609-Chlamydomonas_euryale.AAC.14
MCEPPLTVQPALPHCRANMNMGGMAGATPALVPGAEEGMGVKVDDKFAFMAAVPATPGDAGAADAAWDD